jgi:putative ABC transport system permease protein
MLIHILKMVWNRKKSNALIVAEIAIAFLVVFSLTALALRNYQLYQTPLGFDYQNMWRVTIKPSAQWQPERDLVAVKQILSELEKQPEVSRAHLLDNPTFLNWSWTSSYELDGKIIRYTGNRFDDKAPETFGMTLLEGRWFGPQDSGQNYTPVLINKRFVDTFFPGENVIGKNIAEVNEKNPQERRVVGVFQDFRQMGELSKLTPYLFERLDIDSSSNRPLRGIELKMSPNTQIIFEEQMQKIMKRIAPHWEFDIQTWESKRQTHIKETLLPITILAIVGCFLMVMVAMGLFGVLWQNVTARTQEIGLRRALGSTEKQIHAQIITELLVVSFFGVSIAALILVQLPLLGVFSELNWSLFGSAFFIALVMMTLLSVICAFYPGKIATNYSPSEALHYE